MVLAGVPAILVNFGNADLHGGVVLGLDDAIGGTAFARHVEVDDFSLLVLHFCGCVDVRGNNGIERGIVCALVVEVCGDFRR